MLYVLVILIYALILLVIPYLGMHLSDLIPLIKDPQAQAQLSVPVEWTFADYGYALFYLVLVGGVLFYWRSQYVKVALVATPLFVLLLMIGFAPRVERYVQGPLIDFYKSKKGLDVDIQPLYIKSYACYFYADKRPFENESFTHLHFLYGPISRPAYFVLREKDRMKLDTAMGPNTAAVDSNFGRVIYERKNL